jgi:hypothetical protein
VISPTPLDALATFGQIPVAGLHSLTPEERPAAKKFSAAGRLPATKIS